MAGVKDKYKKYIDKKCNYMAWYNFLYCFFYAPMKLLFPGRALGIENLPDSGGYILAFNHRSALEIPMTFYAVPEYRHFVAKEEHYNSMFARSLFPKMGAIAVNRDKPDLSTIRKIVGVLKKGEIVGIFPEGTRNRDDETDMLQFKSGTALFALQAKVPIVPVYIYRKPKLFRRNYLYIGSPVDVSKYGNGPVNSEKITACGADIRDAMENAKEYLNDVMTRKAYKKEFRAEHKRIKTAKRAAKIKNSSAKSREKENGETENKD